MERAEGLGHGENPGLERADCRPGWGFAALNVTIPATGVPAHASSQRTFMLRQWLFTVIGAIVGILAIAVWIVTFQPHGGVELSGYLFPCSRSLLRLLFQ